MNDGMHNEYEPKPPLEKIPIPEYDPSFLTRLSLFAESGDDPELYKLMTQRFYLAVDVTNGLIEVDEFIKSWETIDNEIKTHRLHKKLSIPQE